MRQPDDQSRSCALGILPIVLVSALLAASCSATTDSPPSPRPDPVTTADADVPANVADTPTPADRSSRRSLRTGHAERARRERGRPYPEDTDVADGPFAGPRRSPTRCWISRVRVQFRRELTTSADGSFTVDSLPRGTYRITAMTTPPGDPNAGGPEFVAVAQRDLRHDGDLAQVDLELERSSATHRISGSIRSSRSHQGWTRVVLSGESAARSLSPTVDTADHVHLDPDRGFSIPAVDELRRAVLTVVVPDRLRDRLGPVRRSARRPDRARSRRDDPRAESDDRRRRVRLPHRRRARRDLDRGPDELVTRRLGTRRTMHAAGRARGRARVRPCRRVSGASLEADPRRPRRHHAVDAPRHPRAGEGGPRGGRTSARRRAGLRRTADDGAGSLRRNPRRRRSSRTNRGWRHSRESVLGRPTSWRSARTGSPKGSRRIASGTRLAGRDREPGRSGSREAASSRSDSRCVRVGRFAGSPWHRTARPSRTRSFALSRRC